MPSKRYTEIIEKILEIIEKLKSGIKIDNIFYDSKSGKIYYISLNLTDFRVTTFAI